MFFFQLHFKSGFEVVIIIDQDDYHDNDHVNIYFDYNV